uniref:Cysteine peptidase n=1 Tax=Neobodo designis TaxID=312471 RepID=A0A7S1KYP1_NEODS|eukprot:CAMPEP_0174879576 /NCGR_PEP_ID=MMETSP1114-20130205/83332_1 /TAXON_ID=312471 /ORGANISM="Neobodo designis, Strain CCAP 1951/1" /LENGTH=362 /DNA_ID=CAMNT_0016114971 /DNA_START=29 /DNA_END=1117 /DNA_ORIENTATION=-
MARALSFAATLVGVLVFFAALVAAVPSTHSELVEAFSAFRAKHGVQYKDAAEEEFRFGVFRANMARAAEVQRRNPLAAFGPNSFADRTPEEFKVRHNAEKEIAESLARAGTFTESGKGWKRVPRATEQQLQGLPTSVDWRTKGVVTPVKNQGQCGSCWAFGTIANIESMWAIAGYPLTSLSEQQLVSCDHFFSYGCNGGASILADWYLTDEHNGTVYTEASYPYVSGSGVVPACDETNRTIGAQIAGGEILLPWDARGMELFLATRGPIAVAIDASSVQAYTGGIMTECVTWLPDHQVTIVGYGSGADASGNTVPYWIIKNSWGVGWGEQGYFRLERGKNLCNVELLATSATVIPKNLTLNH